MTTRLIWIRQLFPTAVAALLALTTFSSHADETITYIHWDAQGSPVAATDESGNVVWRESYLPYGERINNQAAASPHTRWYTGHHQDPDTGLVYAGARYYDPVIGRFLSIDPVQFNEANLHSFNRYAYANNNPYVYIDPDGREGVGPAIAMENEDRFKGPFGTSGSVEKATQQTITIIETADNISSVVMPVKGTITFVGKQAGKTAKNLANTGGRYFWTRTTTFKGTKVYQRDDLIDPRFVDARGRSNLQRMQKGIAPVGPDGKSMNLHHLTQRDNGAIAEMTQSFHQQNSGVMHINPNTTPSGIGRPSFNQWRSEYWKSRAAEF